jgi:hypothetical protein
MRLPTQDPRADSLDRSKTCCHSRGRRVMSDRTGRFAMPLLAALVIATHARAQPSPAVYSIIEATGVNGFVQVPLGSTGFVYNNTPLTFNPGYTFSGVNGSGDAATMSYSVTSSAQSDYGVLRASFNTSLTNAFYNPANPALNPATGTGVPTGLGGQSNANFADRITVTGDPGLTEIRFVLRMTGTLSQSGSAYPLSAGYAALWQNYPAGFSSIIPGARVETAPGGTFDRLITTDPFPLAAGQADVRLLLQASTNWLVHSGGTQYLTDGSSVSSSIDFFNTARVVDVQGFDAAGNLVPLTSAVGESGTDYFTPVPEPLCGLLLPFAGWVLVAARSRLGRPDKSHGNTRRSALNGGLVRTVYQ